MSIVESESLRLGSAVRGLRGRLRLSQEELGYRCGLHRNYVGAIERGEINPTFRTLRKLANGLGCTLVEIICAYDEIPTPGTQEDAWIAPTGLTAGAEDEG